MLKLFDIQGGKVVIHPDMLGIPCFKDIWESNKDKEYVTNVISYIVLQNHHDSPYVKEIGDSDKRSEKLKKELFKKEWTPNEQEKYAEDTFISFSNTLLVQLLEGSRNAVYMISCYLKDIVKGSMDMKMVKEAMQAMASLDKMVKSIDSLEKQVRKEELDNSTVRGGSEVGHYEIPKKRT